MKARALAGTSFGPWLIGIVCFALRAVSLFRSCLSDDEAIYAVVAREMLAGRTLYLDVVDHKPPLIYVVYAITQAVGGPRGGMLVLHLLTIAVVWATALILARVVRQFAELPADSSTPLFAGLFYAVFTTTLLPFDALAANCELFMMLPLVASVLFFLQGARDLRVWPLVAAGLLVGIAMLFKYQAGVQLVLYFGALAIAQRRRLPRLLAGGLALALGVAAALGTAVAVMDHLNALDAAWFWFRFNFAYIKTGFGPMDTLKRASLRVSFIVLSAGFLWFLGLAGAIKSIRPRGNSGGLFFVRFASAWLLVSALAVSAGGRFFGHYFHQVTAPLAVLAAPAAERLWRVRRRWFATATAGPAAIFLLLAVFQDPVFAAAGVAELDVRRLADVVETYARPSDRLLVWGNLPALYFESERPLGTRFVFSNYMTGLSPATPSQTDPTADASPNIVPASWDMFEADVAIRRPRVLVDTAPGNLAAYGKFPTQGFPRLRSIVDRNYHLVAETDGMRVYVRRDGGR